MTSHALFRFRVAHLGGGAVIALLVDAARQILFIVVAAIASCKRYLLRSADFPNVTRRKSFCRSPALPISFREIA